jgi:copper chaperone
MRSALNYYLKNIIIRGKQMKMNLKIKGMSCKSCKMLIEDALDDLGVKSNVDNEKGTATIDFDENKITAEEIKKVIVKEGYQVE